MITVEEARVILLRSTRLTASLQHDLFQATAHRLARDVHATHDHPLFDMSAVDGYAFNFTHNGNGWRVMAEIAAGEVCQHTLREGECARIFTGAMLPAGANTVVMQEFVKRDGDTIEHLDTELRQGSNVRRKGEQLRTGDGLLHAGDALGAAETGLLASAGITSVPVHAKPTVSIVRTGGEFITADAPEPGKIFSSNDAMLAAALHREGISISGRVSTPNDVRDELVKDLQSAVRNSDVVITTGGVSVGDHDLVKACIQDLGAEVLFHGVQQKPGKPMLFARQNNTFIFGLPGNPRAVLVAWYEYVLPFLRAMQGARDPWMRSERLPISAPVTLKGARAEFRPATIVRGVVHLMPDQGSHMLSTMIAAHAIIYFPSTDRQLQAGDEVEVHYLPAT